MSGFETRPRLPLEGVVNTPDEQARRYLHADARQLVTIGQALSHAARRNPDRTAYVCEDRRITFARLEQQSLDIATGLRSLGLRPGERAISQIGTGIESALAPGTMANTWPTQRPGVTISGASTAMSVSGRC